MTEKEMRSFVECGLVDEHEYELFRSIAKNVDFADVEARKQAYQAFLYRTERTDMPDKE